MSRRGVVVVLSCAVLLTACGSESPEASPSGESAKPEAQPSPTFDFKAFRAGAEAECAALNATSADADFSTPDKTQAALTIIVKDLEGAHGRLSALVYPPNPQGDELRRVLVDEVGSSLERLRAGLAEVSAAVEQKDESAYNEAAARIVKVTEDVPDKKGVLEPYGLKECDLAFGPEDG